MGLEREIRFLNSVIDINRIGSIDKRGPHVFVEWPDEPGMHVLRKLSAVRIDLEDLFLAPVEVVKAGRGCFFAHYAIMPSNLQDFLVANEIRYGNRWPIIRGGLATLHLKYGISKMQFLINSKKTTIYRNFGDPKAVGLQV